MVDSINASGGNDDKHASDKKLISSFFQCWIPVVLMFFRRHECVSAYLLSLHVDPYVDCIKDLSLQR